MDLAALIPHVALGGLVAGHGAQKLFGSFGGPGTEGTKGLMEMLGPQPGKPWAYLAGLSGFGGGVLLTLLGFLNPLGSVGVIGSMATTTAHRGRPIWVTEGGAELPVTNIAAAALIVGGAGKYSLDRAFGLRLPGWPAPLGLVAVVVTVLYAGVDAPEPPEQDEAREGTADDDEAGA